MMEDGKDNKVVVQLFSDSDPRYGELTAAIIETIYDRSGGLLLVGILGAIELAKVKIIEDHR